MLDAVLFIRSNMEPDKSSECERGEWDLARDLAGDRAGEFTGDVECDRELTGGFKDTLEGEADDILKESTLEEIPSIS